MKTLHCFALAVLACTAHAQEAQDFLRTDIASDRETPQWVGMYNQNGRWPNSVYPYWFNPANVPANLKAGDVLAAMQTAAARWAGMCNITFQYMGTTAIAPDAKNSIFLADGVSVWGFAVFPASIDKYSGWTPTSVEGGSKIVDADVMLNASKPWDLVTVEAAMTHELGHVIGLGHSNVVESVMFANPYHPTTYVRTLRGDDAVGCAVLYGASANALANRAMNWAEQTYANLLKTGPVADASWDGYLYRYYPGSNSYIGARNGDAFYRGPNGVIQNLGALSNFTQQVNAAGF